MTIDPIYFSPSSAPFGDDTLDNHVDDAAHADEADLDAPFDIASLPEQLAMPDGYHQGAVHDALYQNHVGAELNTSTSSMHLRHSPSL